MREEATTIRTMAPGDIEGILDVAQTLPEWFDDTARDVSLPVDLRHHTVFVAVRARRIVGFASVFVLHARLEIAWLGIHRDHHRQGIGGRLLNHAADHARSLGLTTLAAHTLGGTVDYQPYEATRAFYFDYGFEVLTRSTTDSPSCPEDLLLVKYLA